jgi:hypothetical protein
MIIDFHVDVLVNMDAPGANSGPVRKIIESDTTLRFEPIDDRIA